MYQWWPCMEQSDLLSSSGCRLSLVAKYYCLYYLFYFNCYCYLYNTVRHQESYPTESPDFTRTYWTAQSTTYSWIEVELLYERGTWVLHSANTDIWSGTASAGKSRPWQLYEKVYLHHQEQCRPDAETHQRTNGVSESRSGTYGYLCRESRYPATRWLCVRQLYWNCWRE